MESICEVNPRNKHNEELLAGFIPMASVREGFSNYHDVNRKKWGDIKSGYTHLRDNDVMVAKITPCFQNRKSAIVANLPNGYGAGSTEFHIARTFDEKIIPSFLLVLFKSEYFIRKGLATFTGTAGQQRISSDFFSSFLVALPPTNEQIRLVRAVQNRFQALNDIEKSRRYYKRIRSETPTSLRQQLIQAAIQGQLVPQNPSDEPASVLLERIAQERTAKLGKKAAKSMSRIERRGSKTYELFPDGSEKDISDEIPFEIPDSWEWARLSTLLESCSTGPFGSMLHKSDYVDFQKGIPLINPINIKEGIICSLGIQKVSKEKADCLAKYRLKEGDIILARRGDLSKCAVITKAESKWLCGTGSFFLHLTMIENAYFCCVYSSQYTQGILLGDSVGSTMQNLNQSVLNNLLMPIPPLQEQHRIVEKLGALLKLV